MGYQESCLKCGEAIIAAAKDAARKMRGGVGVVTMGQRAWWCPEHGAFSVTLHLRNDRPEPAA